ncbi:ROK family protein [Cryobacterium adonitolivorans]|uniref:ROK family protein n=1 Tax=Cryobacterium adonitolivorans TaxID=1259189 RepID=A0A4R8W0B7_9MICO|nr:ROK family protein [Cryobacterium adonitolivorans]TFB98678.1 ROK family protein [Cryobacterium adonitolivorans]
MTAVTLTSAVDQALPLGNGEAVIAVDVGGTDTKAALFDASGRMLGLSRTPTPLDGERTAFSVIARVQELTLQFAADFPGVHPRAVGLLAPGVVDDDAGIGVLSTNLHWSNVPFKRLTEELIHLPTTFSHDVRAAGEAEFRLGAARPYRNVVVLVIGTGIAGSLFINGRAHTGGGYAGEIGHSIVHPSGTLCGCGSRGCLETVASAGAIVRRYEEVTGISLRGARAVLSLARSGDPAASMIWHEALDALALSIAQLAAILAPEAIVIGGGLAQAGDQLFVPLRERVNALLSFHRRPEILPASIGENAGLLGGALRARDLVS